MKRLSSLAAVLPCWATLGFSQTTTVPAPPEPRLPSAVAKGEKDAAPAPVAPAEDAVTQYLHFLPALEVETSSPTLTDATAAAAPDRLQTAVVRFEKDGVIVDLVGVVHLADAAYFANLNEHLRAYDVVLYEMVGGPMQTAAPSTGATAEEVGTIRQLQQLAKSFLGLEYQTEAIDYTAPNFVHADVEWVEFDSLMRARNESIFSLLTRTMSLADGGKDLGIATDEAAMQTMLQKILNSVLSGDSAGLKRSVAPLLGEAETFITRLEAEDGTVLVSERNRIVMEKLAEVTAKQGRGSYAIFYGAAHMPDFEKRLLAEGFVKGGTTWLDAWTIPAATGTAAPAGSPAEMILRLLSQNPEVVNELKNLGTLLEDLGGKIKSLPVPAAP